MYEETKINAVIHGADPDKFESEEEQKTDTYKITKDTKGRTIAIFDDPGKYDHLDLEDRKKLTEEMKRTHSNWSRTKLKK